MKGIMMLVGTAAIVWFFWMSVVWVMRTRKSKGDVEIGG